MSIAKKKKKKKRHIAKTPSSDHCVDTETDFSDSIEHLELESRELGSFSCKRLKDCVRLRQRLAASDQERFDSAGTSGAFESVPDLLQVACDPFSSK